MKRVGCRQYRLAGEESLDQALAALAGRFAVEEGPSLAADIRYWDSFDHRLREAGFTLCEERTGERRQLVWRSLEYPDPLLVHTLQGNCPPLLADFLPGPLRNALEPILEMRRLLPRVECAATQRNWRLLDDAGKTRVRLLADSPICRMPDAEESRPLGQRLLIAPLLGYRKSGERADRLLREAVDDAEPLPDLLVPALALWGREREGYSAKLRFSFPAETSAGEAMGRIHGFLIGVVEANLDGARRQVDTEFLHDLRVAVRRGRSALNAVKGVFPEPKVARLKEGLAWIQQITGPVRDLDVWLLAFDDYRHRLPEPYGEALWPLHGFLARKLEREQTLLARKLGGGLFAGVMREWRGLRDAIPSSDGEGRENLPPVSESAGDGNRIGDLATRRIRKLWRRVLEEGKALGPDADPHRLHDLRKQCKKLRYLMEFFHHLKPVEEVQPLIRVLKHLLENLGDFQDLSVQAETLRHFAAEMSAEEGCAVDTLLAIGMLVDGMEQRRQEVREAFEGKFAEFASVANQTRFDGLYPKPENRPGEST